MDQTRCLKMAEIQEIQECHQLEGNEEGFAGSHIEAQSLRYDFHSGVFAGLLLNGWLQLQKFALTFSGSVLKIKFEMQSRHLGRQM